MPGSWDLLLRIEDGGGRDPAFFYTSLPDAGIRGRKSNMSAKLPALFGGSLQMVAVGRMV